MENSLELPAFKFIGAIYGGNNWKNSGEIRRRISRGNLEGGSVWTPVGISWGTSD